MNIFDAHNSASRLDPGMTGEEIVQVAGRVLSRRAHGALTFLDLADENARIQLFCSRSRVGDIDVSVGDIVEAEGAIMQTRSGEPSIFVEDLMTLTSIDASMPDVAAGVTDVETRYRNRHLDFMVNAEARRSVVLRANLLGELREFLDGNNFLEVETPLLQPQYLGGNADPFSTHYNSLDSDFYLRNAPEPYLVQMVVGGFERIYEIGRCFRNEGLSSTHNPEFTMLEWYEAYTDYFGLIDRACQLITVLFGEDPDIVIWDEDLDVSRIQLPTLVCDLPLSESPFAQEGSRGRAQRFEIVARGIEIGDAYVHLTDPEEQVRREGWVPNEDYLELLRYGMPPTTGLGLGIDRTLQILGRYDNIRETLAFPTLRPER